MQTEGRARANWARVVAHTPVPLPRPRFRAQNVAELSMVSTVCMVAMHAWWVQLAERCYLTFVVVFESQVVAAVPRLVPVTSTATYLPRCFDFSLKVLPVAPLIFVHFLD